MYYSIIIWMMFGIGFISFGYIEWIRIRKCKTVEDWNAYFHGIKSNKRSDTKEKLSKTNIGTWLILTVMIIAYAGVIGYFTEIYTRYSVSGKLVDYLVLTVSSFASFVTFMGVIRTFEKNTYILYSIQTIARQCFFRIKVKCIVIIMLAELIIYMISTFVVFMPEIVRYVLELSMLACLVWYMVLLVNLIWEFADILFGTETEHRILKRLYRELCYTDESRIKVKKYNDIEDKYREEGITENLEFLIEEFLYATRKIDFKKIKEIKYMTFLCPKTETYKVARRKAVRNITLFMLLYRGLFCISDYLVNKQSVLYGAWLDIVCLFMLGICGYKIRCFSDALISIFYWRRGYFISYEQRKFVISELMLFSHNKWCKFFISIKNLLTYIIVLRNSGEELNKIITVLEARSKGDKELLIVLQVIEKLEIDKVKEYKQDNDMEAYQMISDAIAFDIRM